MIETQTLICGAGPTGLGAAWRLQELNQLHNCDHDWALVDPCTTPGGMAASEELDGFTWDVGGHVLFSHYPYFDNVLDQVVQDWVSVKPVRGAWMFNGFIPYPVQRNLRYFPATELTRCMQGLEALKTQARSTPENFEEYLQSSFGSGLYDLFFEPLNLKMWATSPAIMSASWTQHQSGSSARNVPSADFERVAANIKNKVDDVAWSDDTRIRYPARGGTGSIWRGTANHLQQERMHLGHSIVSVNSCDRIAELSDGRKIRYDNLVTSMPLDKLLHAITDQPQLSKYADFFQPTAVDVVGIGINGTCPDELQDICSLYFADQDISFWRATILSNYSPQMAPPDRWSILCEINSGRSVSRPAEPISSVVDDLIKIGFVSSENIVSHWHREIPYGYPTPYLNRDNILSEIQSVLEAHGIYSRGRFGGWKYEACNQDHAFMQGVEVTNRIVLDIEEITYPTPHLIGKSNQPTLNSRQFTKVARRA